MLYRFLQKVSLCLVLAWSVVACSNGDNPSSETKDNTSFLDQLNPVEKQVMAPPRTLRGLSNDLKPPK
ncbi:hypothetical protein BTA51_15035 [Hahella sp. CCB-MM4]|uniref:hypothetical protein n=1 Tax=Hahella sp. (strain CCB-MM4) TaxID=1926491 RepID=UPI000B9C60FA|nr:hypothetical protein [Hahella sp. CCB-MM4]OZG72440.1 hypothetical protein BTA51_15035 [Hahella sp. CCB-MM4]